LISLIFHRKVFGYHGPPAPFCPAGKEESLGQKYEERVKEFESEMREKYRKEREKKERLRELQRLEMEKQGIYVDGDGNEHHYGEGNDGNNEGDGDANPPEGSRSRSGTNASSTNSTSTVTKVGNLPRFGEFDKASGPGGLTPRAMAAQAKNIMPLGMAGNLAGKDNNGNNGRNSSNTSKSNIISYGAHSSLTSAGGDANGGGAAGEGLDRENVNKDYYDNLSMEEKDFACLFKNSVFKNIKNNAQEEGDNSSNNAVSKHSGGSRWAAALAGSVLGGGNGNGNAGAHGDTLNLKPGGINQRGVGNSKQGIGLTTQKPTKLTPAQLRAMKPEELKKALERNRAWEEGKEGNLNGTAVSNSMYSEDGFFADATRKARQADVIDGNATSQLPSEKGVLASLVDSVVETNRLKKKYKKNSGNTIARSPTTGGTSGTSSGTSSGSTNRNHNASGSPTSGSGKSGNVFASLVMQQTNLQKSGSGGNTTSSPGNNAILNLFAKQKNNAEKVEEQRKMEQERVEEERRVKKMESLSLKETTWNTVLVGLDMIEKKTNKSRVQLQTLEEDGVRRRPINPEFSSRRWRRMG
jgi:hypothetical protein